MKAGHLPCRFARPSMHNTKLILALSLTTLLSIAGCRAGGTTSSTGIGGATSSSSSTGTGGIGGATTSSSSSGTGGIGGATTVSSSSGTGGATSSSSGTGGATSSSGTGGATSSSSSASSSSSGGMICTAPTDCPPTGNECVITTCVAGQCGTSFVSAGTVTSSQTLGDCHANQCDGAGNIVAAVDDTDIPDDQKACTTDACSAGAASHAPKAVGTSCGTGTVCDGAGNCVGCNQPTDCAGQDTECKTRTCTGGMCGVSFTAAGFATSSQTAGDCHQNQCDGAGNIAAVVDNGDVPTDDGNQCTGETCVTGAPQHPPTALGSACNQSGGTRCSGAGACVQCVVPIDCGANTACQSHTCTAGVCGVVNMAAGFFVANPTPGDCRTNQCDGAGGVTVNAIANGDLPADDGNQCTSETCVAGAPQHPPTAQGTACNQGGGTICNGSGACVTCLTASDCGANTACQTHTCSAGVCGVNNTPAGTVISNPTVGDCRSNQCDGSGNLAVNAADNADLPADDGNQCTGETCVAGAPQHPPTAAGTACNQGGTHCNGNGACVTCLTASDCGADTACQTHTCTAGACGVVNTAAGTVVANPTPGDCHSNRCDGAGGLTVNAIDNADLPADDGNQCTGETCVAGAPQHPPTAQGTACNQGGGNHCDGAGTCVSCLTASDCGTDTACQAHTCTAGACGVINTAAGTVIADPTPGDCHSSRCDGSGGLVAGAVDNSDLPVDGNPCTGDVCTAGVPSNPALAQGTACNQNGGNHCDATGDCVQCVNAGECAPTGNECLTPTCTAGLCGTSDVAAGTPTSAQTAGDCKQNQCDGAGGTTAAIDNTDVPADDGNACTSEACNAGVASHPPVAARTACSQNGGTLCDDVGVCTRSVQILRMGDGSAALGSAATAIFLEERFVSDGALVPTGHNPLAMPTAVSGSNARLTGSGSATSEGALALSADGHFVTLAGYDAATGTAGVATSASVTVNRVVGRVDAGGVVDTSTKINALISGSNPRSAVTDDGTRFWVGGSASGVVFIPYGTTGGTSILASPSNVRVVDIFGGQLYGSSSSGTFTNVFTIGTGLPTMSGATAASLSGMPTSGASPYSYVLVGSNVLYVADDRATASGGGVQKWTLSGSTWTLVTTFKNGITAGCRGVTAFVTGSTTTVVATVAVASANPLVSFIDDGVNLTPTATVLATAGTNTVWRGVALAPH